MSWESVVLNLTKFSRVDTFNEYHISVSESINRQYSIEKIKSVFSPGLVMMHIDRIRSTYTLFASVIIIAEDYDMIIIKATRSIWSHQD